MSRVLLRDGLVWDGLDFVRNDVRITGQRIVEMGQALPLGGEEQLIDCHESAILPGLCSVHTHAQNALTRGILDTGSVEVLINNGVAQSLGRRPEETYAAALLNAIELVRSGVTAVCDQFAGVPYTTIEDAEAVVRAYSDVGLRVTVAPAFTNIPLHDAIPGLRERIPAHLFGAELQPRDDKTLLPSLVRRWHGAGGGTISVGISPSIPLLCSDELMVELRDFARANELMIYTHVAESQTQAWASSVRFGRSIVGHLDALGLLSSRTVLAHCIWIDRDDLERIAASGSLVAHNPASNLRLGSGIAPVREMLRRDIPVGLGTDGSASADGQNMLEAMKLAALVSRVTTSVQDDWISAREALTMATTQPASFLGMPGLSGVIDVGAPADLAIVDLNSTYLHPRNDLVNQLVLAESGAAISSVIVNGQIVMANGTLTTVDEEAAMRLVDEAAISLRERNEDLWRNAAAIAPYIREFCSSRSISTD